MERVAGLLRGAGLAVAVPNRFRLAPRKISPSHV